MDSASSAGAPSGQVTRPGKPLALVAWLLGLVVNVVPVLGGLVVMALWLVYLAAGYCMLNSGGFEGGSTWFAVCFYAGCGLAALCTCGAAAFWYEARRAGPSIGWLARLTWIVDYALLGGLFVFVVLLGEWGRNLWLPDAASLVVNVAFFAALGVSIPVWLVRAAWRLSAYLLRLTRKSDFIAGALTVLFVLPWSYWIWDAWPKDPVPHPEVEAFEEDLDDAFDSEGGFADTSRALLLAGARLMAPDEALVADVRHRLQGWFERVREAHAASSESAARPWGAAWRTALADVFGIRTAWAQDDVDRTLFAECTGGLFPTLQQKAWRSCRSTFRFAPDECTDITLDALMRVCTKYGQRWPIDDLPAYYRASVNKRALKRKTRAREHTEASLAPASLECDDVGYAERCPSPWASQEEQLATQEELGLFRWCQMDERQRVIIVQKAVLGYSDDELAREHDLTRSQAKDIYQNARRKLAKSLSAPCLTSSRRRWTLE
jgi:DNA-directed RNA polymerase specialized sigma24 family protein